MTGINLGQGHPPGHALSSRDSKKQQIQVSTKSQYNPRATVSFENPANITHSYTHKNRGTTVPVSNNSGSSRKTGLTLREKINAAVKQSGKPKQSTQPQEYQVVSSPTYQQQVNLNRKYGVYGPRKDGLHYPRK